MSGPASSGDLAADRRFLWAEASLRDGDLAAAVDLYAQALEAAPGFAAAAFGLAAALDRLGEPDAARAAYRRCLDLAPDDPFGAGLGLARLEGLTPVAMPTSYVAGLFDGYADRFDAHLVGQLGYRGPGLLRAAIGAACARSGRIGHFAAALDLGCGTGLMAAALDGLIAALDGIDLSPGMLQKAAALGRYRRLVAGDMTEWLAAAPPASYGLVTAADVLVYAGALEALFAEVVRVLEPGGLFAVTVQEGEGADYRLGADLRYAHSRDYLARLASANGLEVVVLEQAVTRQDAGRDVPGLVAVLQKTGAPDR